MYTNKIHVSEPKTKLLPRISFVELYRFKWMPSARAYHTSGDMFAKTRPESINRTPVFNTELESFTNKAFNQHLHQNIVRVSVRHGIKERFNECSSHKDGPKTNTWLHLNKYRSKALVTSHFRKYKIPLKTNSFSDYVSILCQHPQVYP